MNFYQNLTHDYPRAKYQHVAINALKNTVNVCDRQLDTRIKLENKFALNQTPQVDPNVIKN